VSALWVGPLGLAGLAIGWLAVQGLWRRVFGVASEVDVLADRRDCTGACCACSCGIQSRDAEEDDPHKTTPKEQGHV
jgi:hypothetical protein